MSKLTEIYNTGVGHDHEAGLQAVWDAAVAACNEPAEAVAPEPVTEVAAPEPIVEAEPPKRKASKTIEVPSEPPSE